MNLQEILKIMVKEEGSDLYLKAGSRPVVRVGTNLKAFPVDKLGESDVNGYVKEILGDKGWEKFQSLNELDVAYPVEGVGRFRMNIYRQRTSIAVAVRWVRTDMSSFEDLYLPSVLRKISSYENGLVLITGPTGSGKSTTQAAMIDYINKNRSCCIITIEDPIEFLHKDDKSIISQREIGIDTSSFRDAMKYVVRQNPDIILVGEMRDPDTFEAALSAGETGHLVMSTLHTMSVVHSMDRIMDFFPSSRHDEIRALLAMNLRALTCQRLLPKKDGKGVVPAMEVMTVNSTVRKLIRENEMYKIPVVMQNDEAGEMQTLNQALLKLVEKDMISEEEALMTSTDPGQLKMNLQGIHLDEERGIV
jgi:twitching motility protein PilT